MTEAARPTGNAADGPSTWTFRADPAMAWTFLSLLANRRGGAVSEANAETATQALDQYGTGRTIDECVALLRACEDAADECETMVLLTESYTQGHDALANRLRAGGAATAAEIVALETAVQKRHDELAAEAGTMSDAGIRMRLACFSLQKEYLDRHPDALGTNELLMLGEQMEVLLDELKTR
jgi:hypothetical protein